MEEHVLEVLKERADFDNYKPRPFNMREFYDRTGHDIKDMLLSCYYRGMECSADYFKVVSQPRRYSLGLLGLRPAKVFHVYNAKSAFTELFGTFDQCDIW